MKNTGVLLGLGAGAVALYMIFRTRIVHGEPLRLLYVRGDVMFTDQGYVTITDVYIAPNYNPDVPGIQMFCYKLGIYPDTTYQSANCQTISAADIQGAGWAFEYKVTLPDGEHCPIPG